MFHKFYLYIIFLGGGDEREKRRIRNHERTGNVKSKTEDGMGRRGDRCRGGVRRHSDRTDVFPNIQSFCYVHTLCVLYTYVLHMCVV